MWNKPSTNREGKRNGQGTYTFPNRDKYEGEFKDGEKNGLGTLTLSDGVKYIGDWKNGLLSGQGV